MSDREIEQITAPIESFIERLNMIDQRNQFAEHLSDIPDSLTVGGTPASQILMEHLRFPALYEQAFSVVSAYRNERARSIALSPVDTARKPGPKAKHSPKILMECFARTLASLRPHEVMGITDREVRCVITDRILNAYLDETGLQSPHSHYSEWVNSALLAYAEPPE